METFDIHLRSDFRNIRHFLHADAKPSYFVFNIHYIADTLFLHLKDSAPRHKSILWSWQRADAAVISWQSYWKKDWQRSQYIRNAAIIFPNCF